MKDKTVSQVIEIAIRREEEAFFFYMDLHDAVQDKNVKETISWIAEEEKKHRRFLKDYLDKKYEGKSLRMREAVAYNVAEYLEEPEVTENMKSEEAFLVAAHREARSHQFYTDFAALHADEAIRDLLLRMAGEELAHKEKMEYLYANTAFPQTAGG